MHLWEKSVLFHDPQEDRPVSRCPVCAREVYGSEGGCLYCQIRLP